jgi:hypothetical protein
MKYYILNLNLDLVLDPYPTCLKKEEHNKSKEELD